MDQQKAALLDLARSISIERRQLRDAINLETVGKPDDERATVSEAITVRGKLRHQRADEILAVADQAPQHVQEVLFAAARHCRAGKVEATALLEKAAAEWQPAKRESGSIRLTDAQQKIVDTVRDVGHRMGFRHSTNAVCHPAAARKKTSHFWRKLAR
jgi:hypothetical protein